MGMMVRKKPGRWARFAAFAAALLLVLSFGMPVFGSDSSASDAESSGTTYIKKWSQYTEENEPAYGDTWKFHDIKDAIYIVLEAGRTAINNGDYDTAKQVGSDGYYGYYDLDFENATNMYISGSRVSEMELLFSNLRTIAKNHGSAEDYDAVVDTLEANLEEDANILDGEDLDAASSSGTEETSDTTDTADTSSSSGSSTSSSSSSSGTASASANTLVFLGCFSILLREGFEAIIVVGAIIAYLQVKVRAGQAEKKKTLYPVYFGSVLGIICSFIMAWLLNLLRLNSSANQEVIEGVTCLIAVCVLFYVSNWMLSKSETEAWTSYIKSKTETGARDGSVMALAFTAFLSVFREGAEVVLFYQPYVADTSTRGAVWAGVIVGAIALVFVYLLIHLLSVQLPMRLFFNATSILMAFMCVCFLGSGIKELVEGGVLGSYTAPWVAWIPYNDVLDVLGIYPLVNTIIPQICLAIVYIIIFRIGFKKNHAIRVEAEKRKAEERAKKEAEEKARAEAEFRAKVQNIVLGVLADQKLVPASALETAKAQYALPDSGDAETPEEAPKE